MILMIVIKKYDTDGRKNACKLINYHMKLMRQQYPDKMIKLEKSDKMQSSHTN